MSDQELTEWDLLDIRVGEALGWKRLFLQIWERGNCTPHGVWRWKIFSPPSTKAMLDGTLSPWREAKDADADVPWITWRGELPHYSSDWEAAGKLIELMHRGVGGHAALCIDIYISDNGNYPDCRVEVEGPDMPRTGYVSYSVPESVAQVFLDVMAMHPLARREPVLPAGR